MRLDRYKTMGEADRHEELAPVLGQEPDRDMGPKLGEEARRSTATSRVRPLAKRTSLSRAKGADWKCTTRRVPTCAERKWFSCMKTKSMPAAALVAMFLGQ